MPPGLIPLTAFTSELTEGHVVFVRCHHLQGFTQVPGKPQITLHQNPLPEVCFRTSDWLSYSSGVSYHIFFTCSFHAIFQTIEPNNCHFVTDTPEGYVMCTHTIEKPKLSARGLCFNLVTTLQFSHLLFTFNKTVMVPQGRGHTFLLPPSGQDIMRMQNRDKRYLQKK